MIEPAADTPPVPVGRDVDLQAARDWMRRQYSGMSEILERVASSLDEFNKARVLVPDDYKGDVEPNNTGRRVRHRDSDELARQIFSYLRGLGAQTLIVQDELSRRALDPKDAFYVDEAVFRSVTLSEGAQRGVDLLRTSSSGYPCDAIICSMSEGDLHLENGTALPPRAIDKIVSCTIAALSSVWDDETYVIMWREG